MAEYLINSIRLSDEDDQSFVLVAAIDFGTTYSGYAFAFRENQKEGEIKVIMNKNWGASQGHQSYKTPTCLLMNENEELLAFGYDAEEKFANADEDSNWHLFRHFKMALFKNQDGQKLTKDITIKSVDDYTCKGIKVFGMALAYLKDHLLSAVELSAGNKLSAFMVKWVVTVPAIWRDEAKQFMREAALEAGLIQTKESRKLLIALEPEGASIECRSLDVTAYEANATSFERLAHKSGTRYLVVDAGGGTVDITGHEILPDQNVKEVIPPSGGDWGGTRVDAKFVQILEDIFSTDLVKKFREKYPHDWLQIMMGFQTVKCSAKPDSKNLRIPLQSWNLQDLIKSEHSVKLEKFVNSRGIQGVKFANGYLDVSKVFVDRLFKDVVTETVDHVKNLLRSEAMNTCSFLFLVGGFGNSSILHDALSKAVSVPVLVPPEAQMAVLKGAVRFGLNAGVIRSRIVRKSYGTSVGDFDILPTYREENICTGEDGRRWANNVFSPLIDIGTPVEVGEVMRFTGTPMFDGVSVVVRQIVASDKPISQIVHTNDPGVETVGSITVIKPFANAPKETKVTLYEVTFGGTEILVKATDVLSGMVFETMVDFFAD